MRRFHSFGTSLVIRAVADLVLVRRRDSRIVTMQPSRIFETVLYAEDLAAEERFYHESDSAFEYSPISKTAARYGRWIEDFWFVGLSSNCVFRGGPIRRACARSNIRVGLLSGDRRPRWKARGRLPW